MGKEKRVLRVLALSLTGIFLLLLLWGLSPGPEWLALFARSVMHSDTLAIIAVMPL